MSTDNIDTPQKATRPNMAYLRLAGIFGAVATISVVAYGITSRLNDQTALVKWTNEQLVPTVSTILPVLTKGQQLTLPGTLQAYNSAPIYARVSGYLKRWTADIGTQVKAGQLLAEIETPDLDQQLQQAAANLATANANLNLAQITAQRWQKLLATDSVSQQEADEKNGDYAAKKTVVAAAQADVARLRALQAFRRVVSPFNGVVTERKTDIGALINAGHDAGHELFVVADLRQLRLYVGVPQSYATRIKVGMQATLDVPEHPGQQFRARLVSISRAVSENSGTELVELDVNNTDGALLAGAYANVHFALPADGLTLQIPASAVVNRQGIMSVAIVAADNRVTFRAIGVARDLGTIIEVSSGLSPQDRIVDNPLESLEDGDRVQLATATTSTATEARR